MTNRSRLLSIVSRIPRPLKWLAAIVMVFLIYNQDAIRGQWKFERLCKEEGGARFYGKVEPDAGWVVEGHDKWGYRFPFDFGHVAFVRYENEKGERFDVTGKDGRWPNDREYAFSSVNDSRLVRYKYVRTAGRFPDDDRFSRRREEVIDLRTGQVLAAFTSFGYSWTKPERVLLNAPTGVICESLPEFGDPKSEFVKLIYNFGGAK